MVRTRPESVDAKENLIWIPKSLVAHHRDNILSADLFFMNRVPMFITLSRGIRLTTVEFTPTITARQLTNKLIRIINFYQCAGFNIKMVMMDGEFEC